jgi:hypothetical protein
LRNATLYFVLPLHILLLTLSSEVKQNPVLRWLALKIVYRVHDVGRCLWVQLDGEIAQDSANVDARLDDGEAAGRLAGVSPRTKETSCVTARAGASIAQGSTTYF